MSTPAQHTTSSSSTDSSVDRGTVMAAARVEHELAILREQTTALIATRPRTDRDHADRAARLALLYARRTGWWRALSRAIRDHTAVHVVFRRAVVIAEC